MQLAVSSIPFSHVRNMSDFQSVQSAARRILCLSTLAGCASLGAIGAASAQVASGDGFLIGAPHGSVTIRGGWSLASARSDVFSFVTSNLTLDRGDFSSPDLDVDLAFRVAPRTDLVFSVGGTGTKKKSEFRRLIGSDDQPIEQYTTFARVPLTVSVKQYLTSRGRSIGHLAWIPSRVSPYVGAGAGAQWYSFHQKGEFVDFNDSTVFPAVLESKGWAGTAHALAGLEVNVGSRFAIVSEARYGWSAAKLQKDFSGFNSIDLSGFTTTAGIAVRF